MIDLHSWAVANRDMVPHLNRLTRYAAQANTVVEFGVRGGVSTWAILDGLPRDGRMWSVDIEDCVVPHRVSGDLRWTFIKGNDMDLGVIAQLPTNVDFVFIDTSHQYRHTLSELWLADWLDPTRIACHDAEWPGVERAIAEFCSQTNWDVKDYYAAKDELGPFGLASLVRSRV